MTLSADDLKRYNRQMMMAGWGEQIQEKLKNSKVFIAGAGGLGSPVSIYLAVAGIGSITIVDADKIELSNLNRQILHPNERIGVEKARSAEQTLKAINPDVEIKGIVAYIDENSVADLIGDADLIMDCLDNMDTRHIINKYAVKAGIPLVHGAIWGLTGQVTFIKPGETPCLKCLFPESPPRETFPVVGATPGVIGCIQAMEAIKYLTGIGENLCGTLLVMDGETMRFDHLKIRRVPDCPHCGNS